MDEKSLLMAKSINDGNLNTIPLRIMNPTNQTLTLEKGYIAATCEVIEIVENKQAASICSVATGKTTAKLMSHLNKLCESSNKNLKAELQIFLCNFENIFVSKSSTDIGRTKLVKHQIDTGNSKPIHQPPTRIPFAKRAEVRQELEDMKKDGRYQLLNQVKVIGQALLSWLKRNMEP